MIDGRSQEEVRLNLGEPYDDNGAISCANEIVISAQSSVHEITGIDGIQAYNSQFSWSAQSFAPWLRPVIGAMGRKSWFRVSFHSRKALFGQYYRTAAIPHNTLWSCTHRPQSAQNLRRWQRCPSFRVGSLLRSKNICKSRASVVLAFCAAVCLLFCRPDPKATHGDNLRQRI